MGVQVPSSAPACYNEYMDNDLVNINPAHSTHHLNFLILLLPIIAFVAILALLSSGLVKKDLAGFSDQKVLGTESQKIDK